MGALIWKCQLKGAFLVTDNRVLNKPLGRSLRSFAHTAHSAHSLHSAPLRYARFARSEYEYVFTLLSRFTGTNALFVFTRNTPLLLKVSKSKHVHHPGGFMALNQTHWERFHRNLYSFHESRSLKHNPAKPSLKMMKTENFSFQNFFFLFGSKEKLFLSGWNGEPRIL